MARAASGSGAVLVLMAAFILAGQAMADVICLFKSEQITGRKKLCYCDCGGSMYAITIDGLQLYPLSIRA
jgi:hypothetical protein